MFPLLEEDTQSCYYFYAVDVSDVAVRLVKVLFLILKVTTSGITDGQKYSIFELVIALKFDSFFCWSLYFVAGLFLTLFKENELYDSKRCCAFQCDITETELTSHIARDTIDIATLIFVLSAISPKKMQRSLQNIFQVCRNRKLNISILYEIY